VQRESRACGCPPPRRRDRARRRRVLDRPHQGGDHLRQGDEAEPAGGRARGGDALGQRVERPQGVGPAVAGPEDVPGADAGGGQAGGADRRLALGTHRDVGLHRRRRLRHAEVDEVAHPRLGRRRHRGKRRGEVDRPELVGLPRRRVRHPDEVQHGVGGGDAAGEARGVQRVAGHRLAARRQLALRARTHQGPHPMPAREQRRQHRSPDVAGAAGHEQPPRRALADVRHVGDHLLVVPALPASAADGGRRRAVPWRRATSRMPSTAAARPRMRRRAHEETRPKDRDAGARQ